jgi:hypothetical protein
MMLRFSGKYFIFHCKQNIADKKRFDLKSNSRYFDLKSHLVHARKNDQRSSKKLFKFMIADQ